MLIAMIAHRVFVAVEKETSAAVTSRMYPATQPGHFGTRDNVAIGMIHWKSANARPSHEFAGLLEMGATTAGAAEMPLEQQFIE